MVVILLAIWMVSTATRLLLLPSYHSTDAEVHRNWMAITHSLPFKYWYKEDTSPWTLDYPPFFAYFEYMLSYFANLVHPNMLQISVSPYYSATALQFLRLSVIISEALLFGGILTNRRCREANSLNFHFTVYLSFLCTVMNAGLILVDHIHFQYNGFLMGILLLSTGAMQKGYFLTSAILYSVLINFKHIFLFASPVYFIFLLRAYCYPVKPLMLKSLFDITSTYRLLALSLIVLSITTISLLPIIATGQAMDLLHRLFPLNRGLTHAYWAPNIWAIYQFLDRCIWQILRKYFPNSAVASPFISPTAGLVHVTPSAALPNIYPGTTLLLTIVFYIPLLYEIWKTPRRDLFGLYVSLGNGIAFAFGWHIHEKAILYSTLVLGVFAWNFEDFKLLQLYQIINFISNFSILPILPHTHDIPLKWTIFLLASLLECLCTHYTLHKESNTVFSCNTGATTEETRFSLFSSGKLRLVQPIVSDIPPVLLPVLIGTTSKQLSLKACFVFIYLWIFLPFIGTLQLPFMQKLLRIQKFEYLPLLLFSVSSSFGILYCLFKLFKRVQHYSNAVLPAT